MSAIRVRRDKAALSSGCKPHPANALPEATGAVMEVTNVGRDGSEHALIVQMTTNAPTGCGRQRLSTSRWRSRI
jgi:hypothetical protein